MATSYTNGVAAPSPGDAIPADGASAWQLVASTADAAIGGLAATVAGKSNIGHTHPQADVTGLAAALAGKSAVGHNHDDRYYTEAETDAKLAGVSGLNATELGDADLDTVTAPGAYSQQFSGSATTALNYPAEVAGRLLVQANGSASQVTQMYWTFDATANQRIYARNFYSTWGAWREIPLTGGSTEPTGDVVYRGVIANGTDVNTLRLPGVYSVPNVAAANTMVNWPTSRSGTLTVWTNADAAISTQTVVALVSSSTPVETYSRATLSTLNTSWSPWTSTEWTKDTFIGSSGARVNADTYRVQGAWVVSSRTYVDGLPGTGAGMLEVIVSPKASISTQRFSERVANDSVRVWQRFSISTGGYTGVAWDLINEPIPDQSAITKARTADVQVSDHATRVEVAASRRGGSIGTGGKPVFMWRFDHWLVDFRDKILPILREFDLPATLNVNYDNLSNEANGGGSITWLDVQDWNQYDGIEIANHGSTHTNANTMASIYHEVVEGRRNLEAAMPRVAVETWQEHGSAYLIAGDLPGDTGLDLGRGIESFANSYAGRLVMAEHAVVEGKFGSFYPPLTGRPQIGQSHYSMDRQASAESIATIQYVQKVGRGLTGYTHPGLMDQVNVGGSLYPATYNEDGSVDFEGTHYATEADFRTAQDTAGNIVHMPTKDFRATCAWLAAERDAGRIMVMSAAGGGFADKHHDRRENLLVNSEFTDGFTDWGSVGGWTISNPGPDVVVTAGSTATRMTQSMLLYTRFGWAMGAGHELLVRVKADTATTLMLRVEKSGDAATWATSKDYAVPGDGLVHEYRLNLALPRDTSITQMTVHLGGASMEIHGPPVLAAI